MQPFLEDCVGKYLELAKKPASSLRQVPTPLLEDNDEHALDTPPRADEGGIGDNSVELLAHFRVSLRAFS